MLRKIRRRRNALTRACQAIFELQPLETRRFLTTAVPNFTTHTLVITGTSSGETITINGVASGTRVTVSGVTTNGQLTQFNLGGGANQINKLDITASGGNDTVQINNNFSYVGATVAGNDGADNLTGGTGPDLLSGGNQNDVMNGQGGADVMTGGSGFDTSNYSSRTENLKITIDGNANDGANNGGEGDNVQTEEVWTGSGNDLVEGAIGGVWAAADYFGLGAGNDTSRGGDGNDNITASTGIDQVFGQNGNDFLQAKNQDADVVNGGTNSDGTADADTASIDTVDTPSAVRDAVFDPAALISTYGDDGIVTGPDFDWDAITAATVDSQGRTIVVGYDSLGLGTDFVATRYNADGTLDNFFGDGAGYGGEVRIDFGTDIDSGISDDDFANGVNTDEDGNIYIVGRSADELSESFDDDFAVAKLDSNGNILWTRHVDIGVGYGSGVDEAHDVVVQNDDKIVVVGTTRGSGYGADLLFAVARLTSTGANDNSFNGNGYNTLQFSGDSDDTATSVALQNLPGDDNAQRIVVGGWSTEVVSFIQSASDTGPNLDSGGGDNLFGTTSNFALVRFTPSGTLDGQFGTGGTVLTSFAPVTETETDSFINDIAINGNNQIYAVGYADVLVDPPSTVATMGAIARYEANGSSPLRRVIDNGDTLIYRGAAVNPAGNLLAVGNSDDTGNGALSRFESDLQDDETFNGGEIVDLAFGGDFDIAFGVRGFANGKTVVGGFSSTDSIGTVAASARYGFDDSSNQEQNVEEVEDDTITTEDVRAIPRQEPMLTQLKDLSAGSNLYVRSQPNSQGEVVIDLYASSNVVRLFNRIDGEGNPVLAVDINGQVLDYVQATTTLITINGTSGRDVIIGSDSCTTIPMIIDGKGGDDILTGGKAGDIILGGPGCDLLYGSGGDDVQVGGDGTDGLAGGVGRSILIGGKGNDGIVGWSDQDIIIGGWTTHDGNIAALQSLIAEWSEPTDFNVRVTNLRSGGGLNGSNRLTVGSSGTVKDDSAKDLLTGLGDRDWFFRKNSGSNKDTVVDLTASDIVDNV